MGYRCFEVSIEDRVAHVILNRPEKRNSMIPEFWDELPAIVRDIDENARARAIVISSTGPHFSSGLDITAFGVGGGGSNGEVWMDERELKRQRRKQSNRESARRSRLRKQAECEELGGRVDALSTENVTLRAELERLKETCGALETDNTVLTDKLKELKGPDAVEAVRKEVAKKKDEAEAKGEEDGKKKENGKTGELTNGKRKAEVKAEA